jgi:glycosyltransferase involved in cell wall biosynthesis
MRKVVIVQRVLPHYRVPLFERLAARLAACGVDMTLVYGQEQPDSVPQTQAIDTHWAWRITNRYWGTRRSYLVWQPCLSKLKGADLIVVEQANRLLLNHLLLTGVGRGRAKLAFWGHGRNLQSPESTLSERIKRALLLRPDWWFAYTGMSARIIARSGFPPGRITTVENSIDDTALTTALAGLRHRPRREVAAELGFDGANLALFCGALHERKRLPFLFAAAERVREYLPDFELAVVGSGPLDDVVRAAARRHRWVHILGERHGAQLAPYLYASRALLMPGLVGLVIVDSFIARTPLVTTDIAWHSPEIEYLESGVNGLRTADSIDAYAAGVVQVLTSVELRRRLDRGCERGAVRYTLRASVERFVEGILGCVGDVGAPSAETRA